MGGVLDEDGAGNIKYKDKRNGSIFYEFQRTLIKLKNKGFILSISSKNNEKSLGYNEKEINDFTKKDFLCPKINWKEKSSNIIQTLKELSLRPDDTVFIDDNLLELEKVKKHIKGINTISFNDPQKGLDSIKRDIRFYKLRVLKEDLKKYAQYKIKSFFEMEKKSSGISSKFYQNLRQRIKFTNLGKNNFNRAIQLFNKTNQFNFSLNRYTNSQLQKILASKKYDVKLFELRDKFGSHGIIGAFVLFKKKNVIEIIDLVISCRVISRYLEDYIIYYILKTNNANKYKINYFKQSVNKNLIPDFLKKKYFTLIEKKKEKYFYEIKMSPELKNVRKFF